MADQTGKLSSNGNGGCFAKEPRRLTVGHGFKCNCPALGQLKQFQISVGPVNFPKGLKITDGVKCHIKEKQNRIIVDKTKCIC